MIPILPAYTRPNTAPFVNGDIADANDVINLAESSGGVNDTLELLANNVRRQLTSGATLNANQDVQVICNATSGAFTVTLPPLATQYKPIFFAKVDNTANWIQIEASGSDKIATFNNTLLPTLDETYLYVGGMSFVLYPDDIGGTNQGWRVAHLQMPSIDLTVRMNANQSLTNSTLNTTFNFDTVVIDTLGAFNTTTKRYTPTVPGNYQIMAKCLWASGTSSLLLINIFKNNATIRDQFNYTTANAETTTTQRLSEPFNGTTDFFEITGRTQGANRIISADSPNDRLTYLQSKWVGF